MLRFLARRRRIGSPVAGMEMGHVTGDQGQGQVGGRFEELEEDELYQVEEQDRYLPQQNEAQEREQPEGQQQLQITHDGKFN